MISWYGQELRCAKAFFADTPRASDPAATLERIRPYFAQAGITRLGNLTHLDRHGIPVTMAARPASRTLATSSGKGLSLSAALTSAAMEALELYAAESPPLATWVGPYAELALPRIPQARLPLRHGGLFSPRRSERWCTGWDLLAGSEVALPYASVALDLCHDQRMVLCPFRRDSSGLASGTHRLEALTSALLEAAERDAVSCHLVVASRLNQMPPRVRLESLPSGPAREAAERLQAAQLVPFLFDCTLDTRIPTYLAYCWDASGLLTYGSGAHLDREVAILRALTESAQARTVAISGSRDDLFGFDYEAFRFGDPQDWYRRLQAEPESLDFQSDGSVTSSFEGDLELLLDRLRAAGIEQVAACDLTPPGWEIAVVRVLVPGLEGYHHRRYQPGPRARALLACRQAQASSAWLGRPLPGGRLAGGVL